MKKTIRPIMESKNADSLTYELRNLLDGNDLIITRRFLGELFHILYNMKFLNDVEKELIVDNLMNTVQSHNQDYAHILDEITELCDNVNHLYEQIMDY